MNYTVFNKKIYKIYFFNYIIKIYTYKIKY